MAVTPRAANAGTVTYPVTVADTFARGRAGAGRAARARLGGVACLGDSRSVLRPPVSRRLSPRRPWPGWSVRPSCATAVSTTARSLSDSSAMPRPPRSSRLSSSLPLPSWTRAPSLSGSSPHPCFGFLAVAGWDVRQHRTRTTESPLRVLGLGAGEEAARLARAFEQARGARRRAGRLRRQSLARGRAGAGRARRAARDRARARHRRDRPDRQPPPPAAARASARRRRPHAGGARAERPLRARLRLRPGGGDQRRLVHRGAHAAPPPAGLGRTPQRRHRGRPRWPPS